MPEQTSRLVHAFAALADLGGEIADTRDFNDMVRTTLHVVLGALGVRRGAVAEYDRAGGRLSFVAAWNMGDEVPPPLPLDPSRALSLGSARGRCLSLREAPEVSAEWFGREPADGLLALRGELAVPLVVHEDFVGVILLGGKATREPFAPEEREVVRALARHIGVGIYNHRLLREVARRAEENKHLYDDLRALYGDTVRAFAAAIDCKDKYTRGHSERVGAYSGIIARGLGLGEAEVEGMAVAGYLHDVGKLVVERDIINAPYRIDAKESAELNRHPAAGYEILKTIKHPSADIPLAARYHHERFDGGGYPEGLKGDEIPLCARVVAVADSFDAMTTERTYKRRKPFPEVVEDLRRNAGRQFSPAPVAALCRALLKELAGGTAERRLTKLLGRQYLDAEKCVPHVRELVDGIDSGTRSPPSRMEPISEPA